MSFQESAAIGKDYVESNEDTKESSIAFFESAGACRLKLVHLTEDGMYAKFEDKIKDNVDQVPESLRDVGLMGPEHVKAGNAVIASLACTRESLLIDRFAAKEASSLVNREQRAAPSLFLLHDEPKWYVAKGAVAEKEGHSNVGTTLRDDEECDVIPAGFVAISQCVVYFAPHNVQEASTWANHFYEHDTAPVIEDQDDHLNDNAHLVAWTLEAGDMFLTHHGNPYRLEPLEGEDFFIVKQIGLEAVSSKTQTRSTIKGFYSHLFEHGKVSRALHHDNNWLYDRHFKLKSDVETLPFELASMEDFPEYRKRQKKAESKPATPVQATPDGDKEAQRDTLLSRYDTLAKRIQVLSPLVWKEEYIKSANEARAAAQEAAKTPVLRRFEMRLDALEKRVLEAEAAQEEVEPFLAKLELIAVKLEETEVPEGKGTAKLNTLQTNYTNEVEMLRENSKNFTFAKLKKKCDDLEEKVSKHTAKVEQKKQVKKRTRSDGEESSGMLSPVSYASIQVPALGDVASVMMDEANEVIKIMGKKGMYKELGMVVNGAEDVYKQFMAEFKQVRAAFHEAKNDEDKKQVDIGRFMALTKQLDHLLAEKERIDAAHAKKSAAAAAHTKKPKKSAEYISAECKHPRRKKHANNMCIDCFFADIKSRMNIINESEKLWDKTCCEEDKTTKELEFVNGTSEDAQQWDAFKDALFELDELCAKAAKQRKDTELAQRVYAALLKVEALIAPNFRLSNMDVNCDMDDGEEDEDEEEYMDSDLANYDVPDDAPISYRASDEEEEDEASAVFSEDAQRHENGLAASIIRTFHHAPVVKERTLAMDAFCKGDVVAAKGMVSLVRNAKEVHGFTMQNRDEADEEPEEYPELFLEKKDAVQRKRMWAMMSDNFKYEVFSRPLEFPQPMDMSE